MQKKNCAVTEVLLSLVLILGSIGFACSAEPASVSSPPSQPSMAPESEIPANYITYTDDPQLFSISYPSDWEPALYYMRDVEKDAKEIINSLKTGLPIERDSTLFIAGRIGDEECLSCGSPNVTITVEPILKQIPKGVSALDRQVEVDVLRTKIEILQGYREFSRVKTIIGGREAVIVDCEGSVSGVVKRHYLMMITLAGKTAWRVTCSTTDENFATWENDFHAIVGSLRISD